MIFSCIVSFLYCYVVLIRLDASDSKGLQSGYFARYSACCEFPIAQVDTARIHHSLELLDRECNLTYRLLTRTPYGESIRDKFASFMTVCFAPMLALLLIFISLSNRRRTSADRLYVHRRGLRPALAHQEGGIFKKYNIDPEFIYIAGGPPSLQALIAGDVAISFTAARRHRRGQSSGL